MDGNMQQTLMDIWNYPSNFEFVVGVTPFSSWKVPFVMSTLYLVVIFLLKQVVMKNRERFSLIYVSAIHNFIMFALSVVCFIGMAYGILTQVLDYGVETLFCDSKGLVEGKGTLYFWMYIFYLTKFYELIDTVLICLRRSQLIFLHLYHHFATGPLCFICLYYVIPVQWIATTLNALVHIPMYWYYFLVTFKIYSRWKKYITIIQIVQFIINLTVYSATMAYHYLYAKNCRGYDGWGSILAAGIIYSYLLLFLQFYKKSYKPTDKIAAEAKKKE